MRTKSYKDILTQFERMYHQWYDDERAGKTKESARYVWARKAFSLYSKNIAIALHGYCIPSDTPIYKYPSWIGTSMEMNKKFPRSIYAGY